MKKLVLVLVFYSMFMQFYGVKFPLKIKRIFQAFLVWCFQTAAS